MNSILLVDDETVIAAEFSRTLLGLGFEVEVAPTVESGLSRAKAAQFDAILVEFNIRSERESYPRSGNGLDVIRQLRMLNIPVPALMFTVMEEEFYETAAIESGAGDFILKTTSVPELASRLRGHIRRSQRGSGERAELETVSI